MKVKTKNYECFSLCDLGASVSTIPKSLCDVLGLYDIEECALNLHLANSTIKKPMGRFNDVLIFANINYVPIDFFLFLIFIAIRLVQLYLVDRFYALYVS